MSMNRKIPIAFTLFIGLGIFLFIDGDSSIINGSATAAIFFGNPVAILLVFMGLSISIVALGIGMSFVGSTQNKIDDVERKRSQKKTERMTKKVK